MWRKKKWKITFTKKDTEGNPLTEEQKENNRIQSKTRARVEHIFGFIEKEIPSIVAKAQRSDIYLDESKAFNLKLDLFLKTEFKSLIADTKYKIVYSDEKDPKKGISQNDLYQMVSYAFKRGCTDILLVYPNLSDNINPPDKFEISSGLVEVAGAINIDYHAAEVTRGIAQ